MQEMRDKKVYRKQLACDRRALLLVITLNLNRLNSPVKGHRVYEWMKNNVKLYAI